MTAGTVVITGGILATVILLCIIAVLCYCRLQVLGSNNVGSTDQFVLSSLNCYADCDAGYVCVHKETSGNIRVALRWQD